MLRCRAVLQRTRMLACGDLQALPYRTWSSAALKLGLIHDPLLDDAGHSKGGNVVLLYAATYDDVPLVVNVAARWVPQVVRTTQGAAEGGQVGTCPPIWARGC